MLRQCYIISNMDLEGKLKRKLGKSDVGHNEGIQGQDYRDCYLFKIQISKLC